MSLPGDRARNHRKTHGLAGWVDIDLDVWMEIPKPPMTIAAIVNLTASLACPTSSVSALWSRT